MVDEPERLAQEAMVKEYIFTGSREKDLQALYMYIAACNKAIRALDPVGLSSRTPDRQRLRMDVTIIKDSLKEELEV
jgi:hypothetical protein